LGFDRAAFTLSKRSAPKGLHHQLVPQGEVLQNEMTTDEEPRDLTSQDRKTA
jgi:hypothetical protein